MFDRNSISGRILGGRRIPIRLGKADELNVATTPLNVAREYAKEAFAKKGKDLYKYLPNFDQNYLMLQNTYKYAKNIPRYKMPVIEPKDMNEFQKRINKGHIDIFKPYARKDLWPAEFTTKTRRKEWVTLGLKDGRIEDDVLRANIVYLPAQELVPLQSQTWLKKLIKFILEYGVPKPGSKVTRTPIIVSADKVILDGHHRVGQVMLADPSIMMQCLYVPLTTNLLLKMTETYGRAIGNLPNY